MSRTGSPPPAILLPYKFKDLRRRFGNAPFAMLDIGAGNHSASLAKRWFPACRYAGVDRTRDYHNDADDFAAMDEFFELDLTSLEFGAIPDASYDALVVAHVIEHLPNGDEVLRQLLRKLKPGGIAYVEFPSPRSTRFPSMRGTLNFYDDDTHVRLYTIDELKRLLAAEGFTVIRATTRRDPLRILLTPLRAVKARLQHGYVPGGVFWDLFGFADVVVASAPR
jgi:ubiquinone/menaquinone biosynthesis C-methylase UbiE